MKLFRKTMPYCVKQLQDGTYVLLNRDYKPIGFTTMEPVRYENHPIGHNINITAEIAAKISHKGDTDVKVIYLYGDKSVPTVNSENWDKYMARFEVLSNLTVG